MSKRRRFDLKKILADPDMRRQLMVPTIQATQAREGIETTREQADRAYYVVSEGERATFFDLGKYRSEKGETDRREEMFVRSIRDLGSPTRFDVARRDFCTIEGSPLAYRRIAVAAPIFRVHPQLVKSAEVYQGLITRDDARYIRFHWEIKPRANERPWKCFHKGGAFSRFYYDPPLVIDWSQEAQDGFHRLRDKRIYFRQGLTWPRAAGVFNVRRMSADCVFSDKGPAVLPARTDMISVLSALLNSAFGYFMISVFSSREEMGGRWEINSVKRFPVPASIPNVEQLTFAVDQIEAAKSSWDSGSEICTRFSAPWLLQDHITRTDPGIPARLDKLAEFEATKEALIQEIYSDLNKKVYELYGIAVTTRVIIEDTLGAPPAEVLWPQMEGKSVDQKRMEHVWRLLSYAVKRVVDADEDGIVPYEAIAGKEALIDRVRGELAILFPDHDASKIEVEIVNELKARVTGYRTVASIEQWIEDVYFEFHSSLYKNRPIIWHITSKPGRGPQAFGALCHYHKFDGNRIAKLRGSYIRDAIQTFKREAALASQEGRTQDRQEWQAKLEEVQELDRKLQLVQEGFFEGKEGGDRDFRILTPWKSSGQRPKGWNPDIDDGVAVNIAPLQRAGVLRKEKVV